MREYNETGVLCKVICNQCKKELGTDKYVIEKEWLAIDKAWGYFSEKDGMIHSFDLCEECYNALINGFAIPVKITEQKELM